MNWSTVFRGLLLLASQIAIAGAEEKSKFDFAREVGPLLAKRCASCHAGEEKKGGLDLTSRDGLLTGGDGGPAVVPGKADASLLWKRIADDEMPPKHPLPADERKVLRAWLEGGAPWSGGRLDPLAYTSDARAGYDWWSLQPVVRPTPPQASPWARNPIDAFVEQRLDAAKLKPSPAADARMLVRRLYFDLIGLPPTPEEVDAFAADASPQAYAALVDKLLTDSAYGERWARHWLDLARFGESQGFERDKLRTNAWRYRDWVIDALNRDLPYDEFVRMQIAGDVLHPGRAEALIATGFLTAGPWDEVGQRQQSAAMKAFVRQDELEDYLGTIGQTFLGLTVNCARCHDHKFDPIRQAEYYALASALAGVHHGEPKLPTKTIAAQAAALKPPLVARLKIVEQAVDAIEGPQRRRILAKREAEQSADDPIPEREIVAALSPAEQAERAPLAFERDQLRAAIRRIDDDKIYAVAPTKPEPTFVLHRGNPREPGPAAPPGGIASLGGPTSDFKQSADFRLPADADDAARRRKLAAWITDARNPLFARVVVNRLWHHHFGVGLVDTPNDFGFNGGRPSHPELLDWLASELVQHDWSLKHVHRLIVSSATYRQASTLRPDAAAIDAGNRLLWRKSPQRLEAETLRDALLAFAGKLDRTPLGPGYDEFTTFNRNSQFYEMRDPIGPTFERRTIYRRWVRSARSALLDVFDCPDPSTKTPQRAVTTTPLQALSLLNNSFVLRTADDLAARIRRETNAGPSAEVRQAFRHVLNRSPDAAESAACEAFVAEHGLPALCRVLFNGNELLYVE